jgi:hypothetical protein
MNMDRNIFLVTLLILLYAWAAAWFIGKTSPTKETMCKQMQESIMVTRRCLMAQPTCIITDSEQLFMAYHEAKHWVERNCPEED